MSTQTTSQSHCFDSIAEVGELIRERKVSPVELVTLCLERINHLQSRLNAFITVAPESALQAARAAETEIQHGQWKGPLHGVPIGIKDFYDTAGMRTTAAFEHLGNRIPTKDAVAVEKLRRAGAIIIGKTNMHTLGMGTTGLESYFGPVKNPWNSAHIPGGSSSGSAAAIASGLCYATLDTDAIGSCRLPAACCGVVGFKGSYGLVDMQGILDGAKPPDEDIVWLSHAGITTGSIDDTAIVLDALAELPGRMKASYVMDLKQERTLRIGVADNCKAEKEVRDAFDKAVETIRRLGYPIRNAPAPLTDFSKGIATIASDRKAIAHQSFQEIDVLILPTTRTTAPKIDEAGTNLALSPENTMFANYYGLPAVSVPCGFDNCGVPLGLQMIAKPWDDGAILQLAHQFQLATNFHEQRPPE